MHNTPPFRLISFLDNTYLDGKDVERYTTLAIPESLPTMSEAAMNQPIDLQTELRLDIVSDVV